MNQTTTNAGIENANELKEGVHFYYFEDGHHVKHKIAIHTHELFCKKTSGTITLEAFRVAANHKEAERPDIETKTSFKNVFDGATKLWFGEPIGVDPQDKQIKWKKYPLRMQNVFDLSKPNERAVWAMISRSNVVEGSPNQSQRPLYKVIDSETKNADFLQNITVRDSASTIIKGMTFNQLVDFAPSLGIHAGNYSADGLKTEFFRYIENNSKKFMDVWDSPTREVVVQFKKAYQLGVIQRKLNDSTFIGYAFADHMLGLSESECIAYLAQDKHSAILSSLVIQTMEKERSFHRGNTKEANVVKVDAEKDAMAKKIAELEERLKSANNTKTEPEQKTSAPPANETLPTKEDEIYQALLVRAKELRIKSPHMTKDPDKLREKIAEAEHKLQQTA